MVEMKLYRFLPDYGYVVEDCPFMHIQDKDEIKAKEDYIEKVYDLFMNSLIDEQELELLLFEEEVFGD